MTFQHALQLQCSKTAKLGICGKPPKYEIASSTFPSNNRDNTPLCSDGCLVVKIPVYILMSNYSHTGHVKLVPLKRGRSVAERAAAGSLWKKAVCRKKKENKIY